jgi:dUTPase
MMSGKKIQEITWRQVVDSIQHELAAGGDLASAGAKVLCQDAAFVEAVAKIALLAPLCLDITHRSGTPTRRGNE